MAARIEGKGWYLIPGEIDASGQPIFHCPTCGYGCRTPAGVRLHVFKVHEGGSEGEVGKKPAKKPAKKPGKPRDDAGVNICPLCKGQVKLLDGADPRHQVMIQKGYTRYCVACEEVFK